MPAVSAVSAHLVVASLALPVAVGAEDAHHLKSVLRLRPGEPVGVTDGRGGYLRCRYVGGSAVVEPEGPPVVSPPRAPTLTVGFAPVKGDRPEWAVQKLTELGVDRIVVLSTDRGVVKWSGDRAASHLARLEKVARAAVMQSRQVWMPSIEGPVPAPALLSGSIAAGPAGSGAGAVGSGACRVGVPPAALASGPGAALCQMGGPPPTVAVHTLLVGPEGGWSPAEMAAAGTSVVGLGPAILRAETAAVAAGVLLVALRAGLVAPAVT